jgi:hypothetical protein
MNTKQLEKAMKGGSVMVATYKGSPLMLMTEDHQKAKDCVKDVGKLSDILKD